MKYLIILLSFLFINCFDICYDKFNYKKVNVVILKKEPYLTWFTHDKPDSNTYVKVVEYNDYLKLSGNYGKVGDTLHVENTWIESLTSERYTDRNNHWSEQK